jgi:hypothetical protein
VGYELPSTIQEYDVKKRATIFSLCATAMTVCGLALGTTPAFATIINTPGYVHLMNAGSRKCIDAGPPVEQWRCLNTVYEEWQFVDTGDGLYEIISNASGECLTQEDGSGDGAPVVQAPCAPVRVASQVWVFRNRGTNSFGPYFSLVNLRLKGCLDLENGDTSDGVPMQIWGCNIRTNNQRWQER